MNRFASLSLAAALALGTGGAALIASANSAAAATSPDMGARPSMSNRQMSNTGGSTYGTHHQGTRDTAALNALEAQGYGDFSNFHPVGSQFQAKVSRNGKQMTVAVNPDTRQVRVVQ